ncbi:MAG: gephyrin-like molybdotransferase Glp [Propionicimonas sp.]
MPLFARPQDEILTVPPTPEPKYLDAAPAPTASGQRSLADHRDYLLSHVETLRPFGIGLLEAGGLTLCESIVSDIDLPTFTAATTSGWAVRASNLVGASSQRPVILPVVDRIDAGGYIGAPLTPGTAVLVAEGAPIPQGADAVMPLAKGLAVDQDVQFTSEATFQQNLRPAGSRVSEGDQLVAKGSLLTPRTLAVIAEVGHDKVLARPRPRVVVLSADKSLKAPGQPLTRLSESYDATATLLAATARDEGAQVFTAGVAIAEPRTIGIALSEQLVRADLVLLVTTVTDDLATMLGGFGAIDLAEVDALPGRQLFAVVGEEHVPVLVLPPETVPAYLGYLMVGRALVQRLSGQEPTAPAETSAPVTQEVAADPGRTTLLLAHHTTRGVSPLPGDQPGAAELADANAIIVVAPSLIPIPAHGDANCWLLD